MSSKPGGTVPPTLEHGRLLSHVPNVINIANGDNGRLYIKLCHFSRPRPELGATLSTALVRIVVEMAELLMNSAIPSEGPIRTSSPELRNPYCANPVLRSIPAKTPTGQQQHDAAPESLQARLWPRGRECHYGLAKGPSVPQRQHLWHLPGVCHWSNGRRKKPAMKDIPEPVRGGPNCI